MHLRHSANNYFCDVAEVSIGKIRFAWRKKCFSDQLMLNLITTPRPAREPTTTTVHNKKTVKITRQIERAWAGAGPGRFRAGSSRTRPGPGRGSLSLSCIFNGFFLNAFNLASSWILHCKISDFALQNVALQNLGFCIVKYWILHCKKMDFAMQTNNLAMQNFAAGGVSNNTPFAHPPFGET